MKLYTIAWQNRPLVCLENRPGRLTPLPYETMNHLLADRPDHRAGVLEKAGKGSGEFALAVVQGRDAKNVTEAEAFDYVFGYTIVNDVSARNLQTGHKQWYFGKGLDGFTPMGPCIVTKEAFPQPPAQAIRTWVNGQLRQEAVTDQLIFSIPHILRELSQGMTLQAGTIIATGTPAGVGMGFDPPRFLRAGDVVRCEIEGIGVLENTVEG